MKKILYCLLGIALLAGCGHKASREEQIKNIEEMEQNFSYNVLDTDTLMPVEMIRLYRQFYTQFADDSLAPVYMERTANMCITLGRQDEAVALFDSIINFYPGYEDLPLCYFFKGFAFENAEQYDSAKVAYTYFIENYPDHYLAAGAKASLEHLGQPLEDMLADILADANDANLAQE